MRSRTLPMRLGLGEQPADARFCWRLLAAFLSLYVVSFVAFYPRAVTNDDEASYDDFVHYQGELGAKEAGKLRSEGKDYVMRDGDVVNFRFNV